MNIDKTDNLIVSTKQTIGRKLKPSDPDFVAPDGGWGWLVVFACGLSNLSILLMYQQFGLIFPEKFHKIGLTHTQTTTILNINLALTSCVGLFNAPIYRKFSFRQVALFGSSLVVSSLLIVSFCKSFWSYFTFYSLFFGTAVGLTQSANALALNTYFKKKRSIATGISWGITGMGPIVWPYVITILMGYYGMEGTVLLFAGFAAHAIMCSLLLQPVYWHTKYREDIELPLMQLNTLEKVALKTQSVNGKTDDKKNAMINPCQNSELNCSESGSFPKILSNSVKTKVVDLKMKTNIFEKIIKFFDLDLLKDLAYLNIIFGMITICYVEFNISVLTPVILKEFHFAKYQIATYLTLLEATDVIVRFSISFVAKKTKYSSRFYFLLGSLVSTVGRIVLIHTKEFSISLFVAVLIGFGKGLIIVNLALMIPNHVSLQKLPAALGIYLATFGMFLILMGPIIGWIRDITYSYVATIHILHIFIYIATLFWILEYLSNK